jgi:hypothetical protein
VDILSGQIEIIRLEVEPEYELPVI